MKVALHQTHQTIGDFESVFTYLTREVFEKNLNGLHLFPELFLTGYPLQDLCLQRSFIQGYQKLLQDIDDASQHKWKAGEDSALLMGGLKYQFDETDLPCKIENVIYLARPGQKLECLYTKQLLPNYDIYDEQKYFTAGKTPGFFKFQDKHIGLLICEDMWPSTIHAHNPVETLATEFVKNKISPDLIINLSASPFHLGKFEKRIERAKEISKALKAPFAYVNRVGGEDEILFDGQSFVVSGDNVLLNMPAFENAISEFDCIEKINGKVTIEDKTENTWEMLFSPKLNSECPPKLLSPGDDDCRDLLESLKFGISEYMRKCYFEKITVALSGGIDSALVLAIAHLTLNDNQKLEAIFMPGKFTRGMSYDLSKEMCKRLDIPMRNLSIKFLHSAVSNTFVDSGLPQLEGIADENIQSRLRGALLYARSNQSGSMVLNTSNKSELAVGYSTQYGDSVGALSVLGDLYKTEVFKLSEYINKHHGNIIPEEIITRPPSAELREDQEDSQSLPPYERLDAMLEGFLSYRLSPSDLIAKGFCKKEVEKVYRLYRNSEYKRSQFCPIIKVKAKSFGFGYRVPITKK